MKTFNELLDESFAGKRDNTVYLDDNTYDDVVIKFQVPYLMQEPDKIHVEISEKALNVDMTKRRSALAIVKKLNEDLNKLCDQFEEEGYSLAEKAKRDILELFPEKRGENLAKKVSII